MAILQGIKLKDDETIHQLDYEKGIGNKPKIIHSYNELEGKPFYSEQGIVDVLPIQDLTFTPMGNGLSLWHEASRLFMLEDGKKYNVNWKGTEYECTSSLANFNGTTGIGIGNGAIAGLGEDTGEPFLIGCFIDTEETACYTTDTDLSITVSIKSNGEIVHQLDSKYVDAYTKEETANLITSAITTALNTEV